MIKLSFKIQLALIIITVIAVIVFVLVTIRDTAEEARFMDRRARQATEYGLSQFHKNVVERAMDEESGAIILSSVYDFLEIFGQTENGGTFWIKATKDTLAADSVKLIIEARGTYGKVTDFQIQEVLLTTEDLTNWFPK